MGDAWIVRPYESDDEDCVVSMWLKSYSRSADVRSWLTTRGQDPEQPRRWFLRTTTDTERKQERYYWAFFRPFVMALVHGAEVRVCVDPERAHSTPEQPSCIFAWACVSPGLVHYVGVKQDAVRAGQDLAAEMVADLLADRLSAPQSLTWEPRDLARLGLVPSTWTHDRRWLERMRQTFVWARKQDSRRATSLALAGMASYLDALDEEAA